MVCLIIQEIYAQGWIEGIFFCLLINWLCYYYRETELMDEFMTLIISILEQYVEQHVVRVLPKHIALFMPFGQLICHVIAVSNEGFS